MSLTQNNANYEHIHMNINIGSIWHEDQYLFFQTDPCCPKARKKKGSVWYITVSLVVPMPNSVLSMFTIY